MDEPKPKAPIDIDSKLEKKKQQKQRREEAAEDKKIKRGSYMDARSIVEEVLVDGRTPSFAIYDRQHGNITYQQWYLADDGKPIYPIDDEEVTKKFLHLPTNAEDYGTDEQLLSDIKEYIKVWLDIPERDINFASYNVLKSWVYQKFHSINYLSAQGDYGSGKSRYLDTIGLIHRQAFKTTATATPAALFRVLNKWDGPTLLMDEADLKDSEETADTIKIINQGYEAGNPVIRCDPNDPSKIEFHNVYCPKVLGKRKEFHDKAVESRCFTTFMRTTSRKNIPPNLNVKFFAAATALRNKLLMWRFKNFDSINPEAAENFDFGNIEPRLKQISTGFVALFINKPRELDEFKTFIQGYQDQLKSERADSWEGQIISSIASLYISGNHSPTNMEIVERADLRDAKGNFLRPKSLTGTMKRLGFGSTKMQRVAGTPRRAYKIEPLELYEHAKLYLDDEDLLEKLRNDVTNVTTLSSWSPSVTDPQKTLVSNEPLPPPSDCYNRYNVTDSVTNVTDVTNNQSFSDDDVLSFIAQEKAITRSLFFDKFGEARFHEMLGKGLIFEPRFDEIRVPQ